MKSETHTNYQSYVKHRSCKAKKRIWKVGLRLHPTKLGSTRLKIMVSVYWRTIYNFISLHLTCNDDLSSRIYHIIINPTAAWRKKCGQPSAATWACMAGRLPLLRWRRRVGNAAVRWPTCAPGAGAIETFAFFWKTTINLRKEEKQNISLRTINIYFQEAQYTGKFTCILFFLLIYFILLYLITQQIYKTMKLGTNRKEA